MTDNPHRWLTTDSPADGAFPRQRRPRFALLGAAGFVAPRHMRAIRDLGGELVAVCDPHDSVGIIDSFAPEAAFFTEIERFDRHLEKLRQAGRGVDYISICTPNYLHDAHMRLALRLGAEPIVEKPAVLRAHNAEQVLHLAAERGLSVWPILQARLHPQAQAFVARMAQPGASRSVRITYVVRRGTWYHHAWKGDRARSGGLHFNLGIHLYDLLALAGCREGDTAEIMLGVDPHGPGARRDFAVLEGWNCDSYQITEGFEDLHTEAYRRILAGSAPTLADALPGLRLAEAVADSVGVVRLYAGEGGRWESAPPLAPAPGWQPFGATDAAAVTLTRNWKGEA